MDDQLEGMPLAIYYGQKEIFNGFVGNSTNLSQVLQLKPNETINLNYFIPGDVDYEIFPYDYNCFSVEFISAESAVKDLMVNGTMYYPAISAGDPRWSQIRWYNSDKNFVYGITNMADAYAAGVRFYSIDYPNDINFKAVRVTREAFVDAFGSVGTLPDTDNHLPAAPAKTSYTGTSMFSGEVCESLSFNKGIGSGQPCLDGVPINAIDSAYCFSTNYSENYY